MQLGDANTIDYGRVHRPKPKPKRRGRKPPAGDPDKTAALYDESGGFRRDTGWQPIGKGDKPDKHHKHNVLRVAMALWVMHTRTEDGPPWEKLPKRKRKAVVKAVEAALARTKEIHHAKVTWRRRAWLARTAGLTAWS